MAAQMSMPITMMKQLRLMTVAVSATRIIMLELAARFCADALTESYFAWNPNKFSSRSQHNRVRAEGQLAVYRSLTDQAGEAERLVDQAFSLG